MNEIPSIKFVTVLPIGAVMRTMLGEVSFFDGHSPLFMSP